MAYIDTEHKTRHYCPRCGVFYIGVGALSRTDNETSICSACGTSEALESMRGKLSPITPLHEVLGETDDRVRYLEQMVAKLQDEVDEQKRVTELWRKKFKHTYDRLKAQENEQFRRGLVEQMRNERDGYEATIVRLHEQLKQVMRDTYDL